MTIKGKNFKIILAGIVLLTYLALSFCLQAQSSNLSEKMMLSQINIANNSSYSVNNNKKDVIASNKDDEMVTVSVINFGRKNPFKPYKKYSMVGGDLASPSDIPPPPVLDSSANNQLKDLMEAKVNGILYDPAGKSVAIINIKGTDYMVAQNDSVFNYYIRKITKNKVTISCGNNTYSVSVGQIIGEDQIKYDPVNRSNQNFGGMSYRLPSINTSL